MFQHKYHTKIDDLIEKTLVTMKSGLVSKLTSVLKNAMEKLSRYDEGTMFGSILGAMVRIKVMRVQRVGIFTSYSTLLGSGSV